MLFLAECIRIFTTWQAIPFKRKFYYPILLKWKIITGCTNKTCRVVIHCISLLIMFSQAKNTRFFETKYMSVNVMRCDIIASLCSNHFSIYSWSVRGLAINPCQRHRARGNHYRKWIYWILALLWFCWIQFSCIVSLWPSLMIVWLSHRCMETLSWTWMYLTVNYYSQCWCSLMRWPLSFLVI